MKTMTGLSWTLLCLLRNADGQTVPDVEILVGTGKLVVASQAMRANKSGCRYSSRVENRSDFDFHFVDVALDVREGEKISSYPLDAVSVMARSSAPLIGFCGSKMPRKEDCSLRCVRGLRLREKASSLFSVGRAG